MVPSVLHSLSDDEFKSLAPSLIDEIEESSTFFSSTKQKKKSIPKLNLSDIKIGRLLGEGGFSSVYEITSIESKSKNSLDDKTVKTFPSIEEDDEESSHFSSPHASTLASKFDSEIISPFVVKRVKDSILKNDRKYTRAFIDLSCELKFLAGLSHDNIIKVRGVSRTEDGDLICIVLDRLYMRMDEQLRFWQRRLKSTRGLLGIGVCGSNQIEINRLMIERLSIALDISSALKYMHRHRLIFRDLKPENIGFDIKGTVKIFDFGLCKELRSKNLVKNAESGEISSEIDLYNLTEFVGSMPFMSPEVYLGKPYNCLADVYSFAFLLYQMIYLKPLFPYFGVHDYEKKVYNGNMRPEIKAHSCSKRISDLMENCWCSDTTKRKSTSEIYIILKDEIVELKSIV